MGFGPFFEKEIRARLSAGFAELVVGVIAVDDERRLVLRRFAHAPDDVDPAAPGHSNINDGDIRLRGEYPVFRARRVVSLTDDTEPPDLGDQLGQSVSNHCGIVRDEHV